MGEILEEVREMKKQELFVTGILALVVSGSASADLVWVSIIDGPNQHPDGLHDTFQVIASFDNAFDQISSVNGLTEPNQNQLVFYTFGGDLYNQALFDGLPLNDFPSAGDLGGELWDSYVTIGQTSFPSNVHFTPDFLGDWGGGPPPVAVIEGSAWSESDGAWYFLGQPPIVGELPDAIEGNDTSDVVIAQFTLDKGGMFVLEGNIAWLDGDNSYNTPFITYPPAPGVLAMFGIAGLAGFHRRRR